MQYLIFGIIVFLLSFMLAFVGCAAKIVTVPIKCPEDCYVYFEDEVDQCQSPENNHDGCVDCNGRWFYMKEVK